MGRDLTGRRRPWWAGAALRPDADRRCYYCGYLMAYEFYTDPRRREREHPYCTHCCHDWFPLSDRASEGCAEAVRRIIRGAPRAGPPAVG